MLINQLYKQYFFKLVTSLYYRPFRSSCYIIVQSDILNLNVLFSVAHSDSNLYYTVNNKYFVHKNNSSLRLFFKGCCLTRRPLVPSQQLCVADFFSYCFSVSQSHCCMFCCVLCRLMSNKNKPVLSLHQNKLNSIMT